MEPDADPDARAKGADVPEGPELRCDFCGERTATVRRVALDGEYERLRTPHREQYACERCSQRKERERTAGS